MKINRIKEAEYLYSSIVASVIFNNTINDVDTIRCIREQALAICVGLVDL